MRLTELVLMAANAAIGVMSVLSASGAVAATAAPPDTEAAFSYDKASGRLDLKYADGIILRGLVTPGTHVVNSVSKNAGVVTQTISFDSEKEITLKATVSGGPESIAAETRGQAQKQFALVRTSHGLSLNLRNNAVYDRGYDWMLAGPQGSTVIVPRQRKDGGFDFDFKVTGKKFNIVFRPRYYQKHKNIAHFTPWTYKIYKDSITGWSSWWAYMRNFNEQQNRDLLAVWQKKHFADYGYRFIQIDDVFQGGEDIGRRAVKGAFGYFGGRPETWLKWRKDKFPGGMDGYVKDVTSAGFEPAIWMGCFFTDLETVTNHPDWFVQGRDGKPYVGPWISCAMDATKEEVVEALIRPTFKGLAKAGFKYVKIDQLRHYLYDNINVNLDYCKKRGISYDAIIRAYLKVAREELGDDAFILACWGVLPEVVGLADACRIGGDGYGPATMQQYNSWNGIVWRNDPDHCDVFPKFKPAEVGNVSKTEKIKAANNDTIIRPALASIAGCMLILSDKPNVYLDDRNLVGLRKSSPVLFSVPGQLYDFDPSRTDKLRTMKRTDIKSGRSPSPVDGAQFGKVCPWWLNEFDMPYGHWNVLHRLNWSSKPTDKVTVNFADLGLNPDDDYLVYEFWSDRYLGVKHGSFEAPAQEPMGLQSFAIRRKLDRPQLVSTSRHLSQGAVDIVDLKWNSDTNTLEGKSRVVVDDLYSVILRIPANYSLNKIEVDGKPVTAKQNGETVSFEVRPKATGTISWKAEFTKK